MWVETFGQCGNGVVEGGEECDDGSRRGGDGCDVNCQACCREPMAVQPIAQVASLCRAAVKPVSFAALHPN